MAATRTGAVAVTGALRGAEHRPRRKARRRLHVILNAKLLRNPRLRVARPHRQLRWNAFGGRGDHLIEQKATFTHPHTRQTSRHHDADDGICVSDEPKEDDDKSRGPKRVLAGRRTRGLRRLRDTGLAAD